MANKDTTTHLYNGRYEATFTNSTHRYKINGSLKPGVTTIMSKVLAKEGLMLWPLNMAMKHLGSLVGNTLLDEHLEEAKKAHIKRRDAGADTGTIVHGVVEDILNGTPIHAWGELSKYPEEVTKAVHAFDQWRNETKPKSVSVENVVYSEQDNYAGTFDSILRIGGKVYLCDLKTTNASQEAPKGVYAEYFIQLGAYYKAYEEQRQYELANGGTSLTEINDLMVISCKKDGRVHTVTAGELGLSLDDCVAMWEATLLLFKGLKETKERLRG